MTSKCGVETSSLILNFLIADFKVRNLTLLLVISSTNFILCEVTVTVSRQNVLRRQPFNQVDAGKY